MTAVVAPGYVGRADVAVAGCTGVNLGELVRAGLPVPPGFVVPTAACDAFVAAARIGAQVVVLARAGGPGADDAIAALYAAHEPPAEGAG